MVFYQNQTQTTAESQWIIAICCEVDTSSLVYVWLLDIRLIVSRKACFCSTSKFSALHTSKVHIVSNNSRSSFTQQQPVLKQQPNLTQAVSLSCVHPVWLPPGKTCTLVAVANPSSLRLRASLFTFNNCISGERDLLGLLKAACGCQNTVCNSYSSITQQGASLPCLITKYSVAVAPVIGQQGASLCVQHFACCETTLETTVAYIVISESRTKCDVWFTNGCRSVQQHGLQGLPFGIAKGTLGVFGHPLGSLLGTAASLSGSIRTSLLGVDVLPPRLRPPRHVSTREPLSIYSYIDVSALTQKNSVHLLLA